MKYLWRTVIKSELKTLVIKLKKIKYSPNNNEIVFTANYYRDGCKYRDTVTNTTAEIQSTVNSAKSAQN